MSVWVKKFISLFGLLLLFSSNIVYAAVPGVPALVSPTNGATGVPATTTLEWTAVSDATNYQLQVSPDSNFTVLEYNETLATNSFSVALLTGTSYYWRVNASNIDGTSDWSSVYSLTTAPFVEPEITVPVLQSPANGTVDVPLNHTLSWSEATSATSYNVQVSTDSNFATLLINQNVAATSFNTSLVGNTVYYWRVKAINDFLGTESAFSTPFSFTTINETPVAPSIISKWPVDGATGVVINDTVYVSFDIPINASTINTNNFYLLDNGTNQPIAGTVSYSDYAVTATFTPAYLLETNKTYKAVVTSGIQGTNGLAISNPTEWTFTTEETASVVVPNVTSVTPTNNATDVPVDTNVTATFDMEVDPTTVNNTTFTLKDAANNSVAGNVSYDGTGSVATFNPNSPLSNNTVYTATVKRGVKNWDNVPLAADYIWSFTTVGGVVPATPTVSATNPLNNATGVNVGSNISAIFDMAMDPMTIDGSTFTLKDSANNPVSGAVLYDEATQAATFVPANPLAYNTVYTATVTTAVQSAQGASLAANYAWSFTMEQAPQPATPNVTSTNPANTSNNVPLSKVIEATFDIPMDQTTINATNFRLKDAANNPVSGAVSYNAGTKTASFNPDSDLAYGASYTAELTSDILSAEGASLPAYSWNFTTVQAPQPVAPKVASTNPANNAVNVALDSNISATLDKAIDPATINSTNFVLSGNGNSIDGIVKYDAQTKTATFDPNNSLKEDSQYIATLKKEVKGVDGISMEDDVVWTFRTKKNETPNGTGGGTVVTALTDISEEIADTVDDFGDQLPGAGQAGIAMLFGAPGLVIFFRRLREFLKK